MQKRQLNYAEMEALEEALKAEELHKTKLMLENDCSDGEIQDTKQVETGTWVILELFGHKVVSGYMSKDESLGAPLVRIDVPKTSLFPEFTRHYNPGAIYSISYVSEEVARITAESLKENPVSVYVPELGEINRLTEENKRMRVKLERFQRALSDGSYHEINDEN